MNDTIKNMLLAEPTITPLAAVAKRALQAYELFTLVNADALNPVEAVQRLTLEMQRAPSGADISTMQAEIAKFTGPGADAARDRATALGLEEYQPAREAVLALLREVEARLQAYKARATNDEKALFASHGLPHESTSCSRRFDPMLGQVRDYIGGLMNPPPLAALNLPLPHHPVVSWLTEG